MIAVIFEVEPLSGKAESYFQIAADLRERLAEIDGFVSVERFESLSRPGVYLSLSYWRDEAAARQWRNIEEHRAAQSEGSSSVFRNYRIRVAQVVRDYGMNDRAQAPADATRLAAC